MEIKLIDGQFTQADALELLSKMVDVKVKFHENKIGSSSNEEDIKLRENKIKRLQENLAGMVATLKNNGQHVCIQSAIAVD